MRTFIFVLLSIMLTSCTSIKPKLYKVDKETYKDVHFVTIESQESNINLQEVSSLYQFSECRKFGAYSQLIASRQEGNKIEQTFVCNQASKEDREAQVYLEKQFCERNNSEINKDFCNKTLGLK